MKKVPTGRLGTVKDVNNATVFLLSETGDFVNGSVQVGKLTPISPRSPHLKRTILTPSTSGRRGLADRSSGWSWN